MLDKTARRQSFRPRLAIVSTFDDLCGIAGYTRALVKQLEPSFDIEVFDLDQFFMRSKKQRVRRLADDMIRDFCSRMKDFDFVNIQLEHGTLGHKIDDISRRFALLAKSAPALSVTFHTVLSQEPFNRSLFSYNIKKFRLAAAWDVILAHVASSIMVSRMYRLLRRLQDVKPVRIIVHTRRDMRIMKFINGFRDVYDHPLAFMSSATAEVLRASVPARRIAGLSGLPEGAKTIGVFGFLSEYKGVDTVIGAMHLLPDDYHLLIFGGLHPNEIKKGMGVHPYVELLLEKANVATSLIESVDKKQVVFQLSADSAKLLTDHPKDIGSRVHFLGPQTDEGFAAHMAACDHVVLPYLEIGQSSSGVMSVALEMGARIIAARNHAFMQFARYHPDTIELFEIGNVLELAERIRAEPAYPREGRRPAYDVTTNTAMYVEAHTLAAERQRVGATAEAGGDGGYALSEATSRPRDALFGAPVGPRSSF